MQYIILLKCIELIFTKLITNINNFNTMPAYSMGKANKQASFISKNQTPGAGYYKTDSWNKVSRIKTSPSASMPKTKKFFDPLQKLKDSNGPGSYNPEKSQVKLMASMKSRKQISYCTQTPSPADYNPDVKFSSKKYSFGRSIRKFKTQQGPGPGQYISKLNDSKVGVNFGTQERNKNNNQKIPGPGAYIKQITITKDTPQFSFCRQKKFMIEETQQKNKSKIPGPGTYSINEFKRAYQGGKFTYGERMTIADKIEGPGPHAYQPKYISEKKSPKAIIGNQKRIFYRTNPIPGPGSYETPKAQLFMKKDGITVFPHEERQRKYYSQTPGPGSYQNKPLYQSRACTINARHPIIIKDKVPGPQQYSPQFDKTQLKPASAIFGSQSKLKVKKNDVPGPGQYKIETFEKSSHSRTFYFNKAKNIQKLNSTIGPGHYKLKHYIGNYDGAQKVNKDIYMQANEKSV